MRSKTETETRPPLHATLCTHGPLSLTLVPFDIAGKGRAGQCRPSSTVQDSAARQRSRWRVSCWDRQPSSRRLRRPPSPCPALVQAQHRATMVRRVCLPRRQPPAIPKLPAASPLQRLVHTAARSGDPVQQTVLQPRPSGQRERGHSHSHSARRHLQRKRSVWEEKKPADSRPVQGVQTCNKKAELPTN